MVDEPAGASAPAFDRHIRRCCRPVLSWSVWAVLAALAVGSPVALLACENDGIPGYNHATGLIDADPYAGAYTEVAQKVARDQRDAAMERARLAFVQRLGLRDADALAAAPAATPALAAPGARPD